MLKYTALKRSENGHVIVKLLLIILIVCIVGIIIFFLFIKNNLSSSLSSLTGKPTDRSVIVTVKGDGETKTISSAGGTLSVGEEEEQITLDVPSGAILGSQTINLAEIKSLSDLPLGATFVSGVHIDTQDITIVKPLKITIPVPSQLNTSKVSGFVYDGEGNTFRQYPVTVKDGIAEFVVFHASGYGLISIDGPDFKPYTPSNARAKAEQEIASMVSIRGIEGGNGRLVGVLQEWYHNGVKPKLAKSLGNGDFILDAIHEYFSWLGFAQFFGIDDDLESEITDANKFINKALVNAYEKASSSCVKEKDPGQIARLLKLAQIVQYLGREEASGLNSEEMIKKARSCASFTLKISSNFQWEDGADSCGLFEEDYSGEIPITVDENFALTGTGQIILNRELECGTPCSIESGPDPYTETFSVVDTKLQITEGAPEITLALRSDSDTESRLYCPQYNNGDVIMEVRKGPAWLPSFISENISMSNPNPIFYISGWEIMGKGSVYARKVYDEEAPMPFSANPTREHTVLELIHNPK